MQEYMAAETLHNGDDEQVQTRLTQIAKSNHWENVFLFAAGKCFAERQHLRDTVFTICRQLNEDSTDELLRTINFGSHLAKKLLDDGSARRQPKYSQCFARTAFEAITNEKSSILLGPNIYD